jgi:hypothetical protein
MEAREKKEGAVVRQSGLDPHKSLFSQFLYAIDNSFWNLKDPSLYNDPSLLSNPSLSLDPLGKPLFIGVINVDPTTNPIKAFGATNPMPIVIADGTTPATKASIQPIGDINTTGKTVLFTGGLMYYFSPDFSYAVMARTPTVWKSALISANGSTAIWTSAAGKKARLMGFRATLINGTTAAAACLLRILDVAADTGIGVQVCGAALGAVATSAIIANESYMNGKLMAATNTAINIDLSSALAVAGVFVQVWGTEE